VGIYSLLQVKLIRYAPHVKIVMNGEMEMQDPIKLFRNSMTNEYMDSFPVGTIVNSSMEVTSDKWLKCAGQHILIEDYIELYYLFSAHYMPEDIIPDYKKGKFGVEYTHMRLPDYYKHIPIQQNILNYYIKALR
jgi:hypothetical protein